MHLTHYARTLQARLRRSLHPDPVRDWFILLGVFGIAFVGTLVWNTLIFQSILNGEVAGDAAQKKTAPVVDEASLDTVRTFLDSRALEETKYQTGAYHFTDPSQ